MIKFTCINEQHADIAAKQLRDLDRDAKHFGRAVIASGNHDNNVAKVMCAAMAYSETPNEWDIKQL